MKSTLQIQLAIVFLENAMADLLMSWGIRPCLLIGCSLGEYAALCISSVLSVTGTLYLVGKVLFFKKTDATISFTVVVSNTCPVRKRSIPHRLGSCTRHQLSTRHRETRRWKKRSTREPNFNVELYLLVHWKNRAMTLHLTFPAILNLFDLQ